LIRVKRRTTQKEEPNKKRKVERRGCDVRIDKKQQVLDKFILLKCIMILGKIILN